MKKKVGLHESSSNIINLFQERYPGILEIRDGTLTLYIQANQVVKIHNKDIKAMGVNSIALAYQARLILDPEDVRPLVGDEAADAAAE